VAFTTESLKRTYVVQVSGILSRPSVFVTHVVTFVARRGDLPVASGILFEGDSMDGGFRDSYQQHDWPAENVLRFVATGPDRTSIVDRISITSKNTSRRIPFIRIRSRDLFVVLDVPPGASVAFAARREETSFIWAEAHLEGVTGSLYAKDYLSSDQRPDQLTPMEIDIEVTENDIRFVRRAARTR
jgi:hypothetical protein